jgi:uncharacterized DUF497 family protein
LGKTGFEWDAAKDLENQQKHGVSFAMVDNGVLTVRFTYRETVIRIIGAGYWRKGKAIYEDKNQIHQ